MRVATALGSALTLMTLLLATGCVRRAPEPVAVQPTALVAKDPGRSEVTFAREQLAPDRWRLHVRRGAAVSPAGGAMSIMQECARLTADAGFTWWVTTDQRPVGQRSERRSLVELTLSHELPADYVAMRFDDPAGGPPPLTASDPDAFAVHAPSLLETFDRMAAAAPARSDEPLAATVPEPVLQPEAWTRELFFEDPGLGDIRSLTWAGDRLAVAGREAVVWIDATGQVLERVDLEPRASCPVPLDLDGDGRWEYRDAGGGWSAVGLRDTRGRVLWSVDGGWLSPSPNGLTAADLDGDGTTEFLVGFNAGGGLRMLDAEGETLWSVAGSNVFHADAFDLDGDGLLEIVHASGGGLLARDRLGRELDAELPDLSSFCTVRDRTGRPVLGTIQGGAARLFDPVGGAELARFAVPGGGHSDFELAWLERDGRGVAAVARTLGAANGVAELLLFDADTGARLHHEELAVAYLTLARSREGPSADAELLVGAGSQVWRYRPAD